MDVSSCTTCTKNSGAKFILWFKVVKYENVQNVFYLAFVNFFVCLPINMFFFQITGSVVYTRWGKETCPSGAELVLSGKFDYLDAIHLRNPSSYIKKINT